MKSHPANESRAGLCSIVGKEWEQDNKGTLFCRKVTPAMNTLQIVRFGVVLLKPVSYTHLTLPTIYSV